MPSKPKVDRFTISSKVMDTTHEGDWLGGAAEVSPIIAEARDNLRRAREDQAGADYERIVQAREALSAQGRLALDGEGVYRPVE